LVEFCSAEYKVTVTRFTGKSKQQKNKKQGETLKTLNSLAFYEMGRTKTCYRCGSEFSTDTGRICSVCRKPRIRARKPPISRNLSFREKQIAQLVSKAKLNKEIAFELRLTEGTIKEYLNRIFRKLEVKNRTELAIWALQNPETAS
jgi:DNA-binding CsgD family transcriptional regulator